VTESTGTEPVARIAEHEAAYWTCVSSVEQRDGWKLYHNIDFAGRVYPNHAGDFRAPEGTGASIAQGIITFFQSFGAAPAAFVDALSTPGDLVPSLLATGFEDWAGATSDLMLYVGPDQVQPSTASVRRVQTPADRAGWASVMDQAADPATRSLLQRLYMIEISDPRVTAYLVRIDGHAVARCELFTCDGLGRVEAVFTLPAYRGRRLASALIRRAVADSIAEGNHLTYIQAEPGGNAQRLYERLGFRTIAPDFVRGFVWGR
jgi:GNAT superfamily N-acetyltransferase